MQHNIKILRSDLPTYFIEKERKLRAMEVEAQDRQDHISQMIAGLIIFAAICAAIALVYSFQAGWWR